MGRQLSLIGIVFFAAHVYGAGSTSVLNRTGPAADPEAWPDWGGTPDIAASQDVGLTVGELDGFLSGLKSPDRSTRSTSKDEIIRDAAGSEAAFRTMLFKGHGARNGEMKSALKEARKRAETEDKKGDLLEGLLSINPLDKDLGRGATGALRILTMLVALDSQDTMAAYKVMIDFSPRHAGMFRHEIGRMLTSHGMAAMPALIYGRGSKNKEIHMFSVKWIRDMGNPLLSEQVKLRNPRRLAQLLEAYASVNELDAIEVTLSLTNHRSSFVRAAARSALVAYGRNALWPARRKFENTFNDAPKSDASVEEVLQALYDHFDKKRLMATEKRFAEGLAAYQAGRLQEMETAYRDVLSKEPLFSRRGEMADGFLALSRSLEKDNQSGPAKEALLMALWVSDPSSAVARKVRAMQLWLEAREFRRDGLAAPGIYERILALDPEHDGAKEMLAKLLPEKRSTTRIIVKAVAVSLLIFIAATLVFLRIRNTG